MSYLKARAGNTLSCHCDILEEKGKIDSTELLAGWNLRSQQKSRITVEWLTSSLEAECIDAYRGRKLFTN